MKRATSLIAMSLLSSLLLALGACAAPPPPAATVAALPGGCDAAKAQFAVGHPPGLALQDQARQRSGARTVRTLRPGQVVTMEYTAERLNLELDASGTVVQVRCG